MISPMISEAVISDAGHTTCMYEGASVWGAHKVYVWNDGGVVSHSVCIRIGRGASVVYHDDFSLKF